MAALRVARSAAHEGSANSLAVKHPGRKAREELVQQTGHQGRIAALAATSKEAMKVEAGKGAVTESWAPENLPVPSAQGARRMFRQTCCNWSSRSWCSRNVRELGKVYSSSA